LTVFDSWATTHVIVDPESDTTVMLSNIQVFVREFTKVPFYHLLLEAFLFAWIYWLLYNRSRRGQRSKEIRLTREEEHQLLSEWHPEPLVPSFNRNDPSLKPPVLSGKLGKFITMDGVHCLDMATHNYLGLSGNSQIERAAADIIGKYGVGSCGPRAFYGTTDVHITLEERLANFLGMEQAVSYSYAFSTVASAIPAYAKKGDIIYADKLVSYAIQRALLTSKSRIVFFDHNDANHLEQLLEEQAKDDQRNPKAAKISRRFLIVEGIYLNGGDLCKIEDFVPLKHKYRLRFFIDESVSFGTLGRSGRGLLQHKNIKNDDIDAIVGSFEHGLGSVGGFVAGTSYVVDHQILAGLGYTFSASLPPLLAAAVTTALDMIDSDPEHVLKLQDNALEVHNQFESINGGLELHGDRVSPVKHLRLAELRRRDMTREREIAVLRDICHKARASGLALTVAAYLEDSELNLPPASIRLTCSNQLDQQDIAWAAKTLGDVCKEVLGQRS